MTSILDQWATYRKTCHQEYEADTLGDEMAREIERLQGVISKAMDVMSSDKRHSADEYTLEIYGFGEAIMPLKGWKSPLGSGK